MFNTKQGVFGPGGHGGGIFQTTVAGLGTFNTKQGVFGPGGHGGGIFQTTVSGLGKINYCWDDFGFKGCHTEAGAIAHRFCQNEMKITPGSSDWNGCYQPVFLEQVENCSRKYCNQYTPGAGTSMKDLPRSIFNALTKDVQTKANTVLPGLGYNRISVDGKLGGGTCGAIKVVIDSGKIKGWVMPTACSGITRMPTKAGGGGGGSSYTPTTSPALEEMTYKPPMSTGKKVALAGAGVLLIVGGYVAWSKMK
jgi:hypothetical protein